MKNGAAVGCSRSHNAETQRRRCCAFVFEALAKSKQAEHVVYSKASSNLETERTLSLVFQKFHRASKKTSFVWVYKEHSVTLLQKT